MLRTAYNLVAPLSNPTRNSAWWSKQGSNLHVEVRIQNDWVPVIHAPLIGCVYQFRHLTIYLYIPKVKQVSLRSFLPVVASLIVRVCYTTILTHSPHELAHRGKG